MQCQHAGPNEYYCEYPMGHIQAGTNLRHGLENGGLESEWDDTPVNKSASKITGPEHEYTKYYVVEGSSTSESSIVFFIEPSDFRNKPRHFYDAIRITSSDGSGTTTHISREMLLTIVGCIQTYLADPINEHPTIKTPASIAAVPDLELEFTF